MYRIFMIALMLFSFVMTADQAFARQQTVSQTRGGFNLMLCEQAGGTITILSPGTNKKTGKRHGKMKKCCDDFACITCPFNKRKACTQTVFKERSGNGSMPTSPGNAGVATAPPKLSAPQTLGNRVQTHSSSGRVTAPAPRTPISGPKATSPASGHKSAGLRIQTTAPKAGVVDAPPKPSARQDLENRVQTPAPNSGVVKQPGAPNVKVIPLRGASPVAYCKRDRHGNNVLVTLKNFGTARSKAGSSIAVVFANTQPPISKLVGALAPGESVTIPFAIPRGCFSPDCKFSILLGTDRLIAGICIG